RAESNRCNRLCRPVPKPLGHAAGRRHSKAAPAPRPDGRNAAAYDAGMVRVRAFDHVVLNVADVERSLAWYCGELGLEGLRVEEWRRGEVFFPSLRLSATRIVDLLQTELTGQNVDHVCLVVEPTDLEAIAASGRFE